MRLLAFRKRLKWIDAQKENVLDAPYYHVVFTVPEELNPVIYSNQKLLYDALYHAASSTLNELTKDSKYLGADIGRSEEHTSELRHANESRMPSSA